MAHTYTNLLVHCVFSTKHREKTITADFRNDLWAYMGGIARTNHMKALTIGGIDDHVHSLLSMPATIEVAKAVQLIKGGSSKWAHDGPSMAERLRRIHHWRLAAGGDHPLHRPSGGAPPEVLVRG